MLARMKLVIWTIIPTKLPKIWVVAFYPGILFPVSLMVPASKAAFFWTTFIPTIIPIHPNSVTIVMKIEINLRIY